MLGCSMSRFSIGLVSTLIVVNPPAVKHGGGVINQLSSIGQDSNWRKQESVVSAKHSTDVGKQEKTEGCSVGGSSRMSSSSSSSSAGKPVQVSGWWATCSEIPWEGNYHITKSPWRRPSKSQSRKETILLVLTFLPWYGSESKQFLVTQNNHTIIS